MVRVSKGSCQERVGKGSGKNENNSSTNGGRTVNIEGNQSCQWIVSRGVICDGTREHRSQIVSSDRKSDRSHGWCARSFQFIVFAIRIRIYCVNYSRRWWVVLDYFTPHRNAAIEPFNVRDRFPARSGTLNHDTGPLHEWSNDRDTVLGLMTITFTLRIDFQNRTISRNLRRWNCRVQNICLCCWVIVEWWLFDWLLIIKFNHFPVHVNQYIFGWNCAKDRTKIKFDSFLRTDPIKDRNCRYIFTQKKRELLTEIAMDTRKERERKF